MWVGCVYVGGLSDTFPKQGILNLKQLKCEVLISYLGFNFVPQNVRKLGYYSQAFKESIGVKLGKQIKLRKIKKELT